MSLLVKNAAGSRCSLAYCTSLWSNNNDEIKISFFKFPKDHSRCASWVEKCEAQYLPTADLDVLNKTYKWCSLHFETNMFQNTLKNRLTKTDIPTLFAKKPAEYQDNSFVGCKNFEISNLSSEGSLMADNIFSVDDHPSCSTLVSSSSRSIIGGGVSVSTSTEICEATTGLQTPKHLSLKTPRKEALRKKLAKAHTNIKKLEYDVICLSVCLEQSDTIENVLQLVEKYISPSLFIVVKNNVLNKDKNPKGRCFSNEIKQFALIIYFLGPSVFHLLQRNFCLPTIRTLRKITSKYEFQSGLNDFMFNFLSFKTKTFSSDALNCILCADEMSLKTNLFYNLSKDQIIGFNHSKSSKTYDPAKHVLVLMIRGINHNWKQPLAYYLISNSCTGSDLNNIIVSTIRKLKNININVKAFVTDQGSNFVNFSKINGVTPEEPYFEIDNDKIIYIFDPPHLLKSTRNMFFKHNLIVNNDVIEKKHVDTFYNNVRMAPKLTYSHIHPSPFERMKVRLAAYVFSHSVSTGMSAALNQGILPKTSKYTINFINFMDRLFDIFNSSDTPNSKIYNTPFTNDRHQLDHLNKMVEMFKT